MIKVFVIEPSERVDVVSTEQFGSMCYVFPSGAKRSSFWSSDYVEDTLDSLAEQGFDVSKDIFVISGHFNPVVIIVAKLVALYGSLNVLMWNSVHRCYEQKTIGENYK